MKKQKQPDTYIGITDFMLPAEVKMMRDHFAKIRKPNSQRKLHIGIMVSYKTLNRIPTRFADAYLPIDRLPHIFLKDPLLLNTLHYADYRGIDVADNLKKATDLAGDNMDCLQLDMVLPEPKGIIGYRKKYPGIKVVLQINSETFARLLNNPYLLVSKLRRYKDSVDYFLLDQSVGRGIPMKSDFLLPFIEEISKRLPHIGIAIAGGLGPNSLNLIKPIIGRFPNISIDAQSKLRKSGTTLDPIDWNMAKDYLKGAVEMLN